MRLTLRTMLAYLDDILDPADAEQIAEKIKESEFASGLVHRIRGSMRKLRLGAPKLEGKGIGLDSNTVAEYLDNTLTSDRVPDFEKVCLESDIHLAEVASCHQILTLVLGEPADIPAELRDRMYGIPDQATETREPESSATAPSDATDASRPPMRAPTEPSTQHDDQVASPADIPDYMKAGTSKRKVPLLVTALLLFLAFSIAVFAIGPQNIARWFGGSTPADVAERSADEPPAPDQGEKQSPADKVNRPKPTGPAPTKRDATEDADASRDSEPADAATEPPQPDSADPETTTNDAAAAAPKIADAPDDQPETRGKPDAETPVRDAGPAVTADKVDDKADEPSAEKSPVELGRFLSERQILARFDSKSLMWQRLSANSQVLTDDRLFVLPAYRPQVIFSSGAQLTLGGPAACTLLHPDENEAPGMALEYGQAMIMTISKPNAQFHLDLAGSVGTLTFLDADSAAAIDVQRYLAPGENPESTPARPIVQIIASYGKLHWQSDKGESTTLTAGEVMVLDRERTRLGTLNVLPTWLETSALDGIDEIASNSLEPLIPADRSLELALEEVVLHKNVELRMFAARSLTYLDSFDAFVNMLSDERNKSFWRKHLNAVKQALARGPESARAVRVAFEKRRGAKADDLYRLTWGYSPSQLAAGDDARLVEFLRHNDLDVRVLAWENLWRITGRTGLYRPEGPERSRTIRVRTWEETLENGEIVYRAPPVPPTLIPLD